MVTAGAGRSRGSGTTQLDFESKNVNGVINKFNAAWDLSFTSLK